MAIFDFYDAITAKLRASGDYVWPLALRLILAWEFWESGITKHNGDNWFANIPWMDWQKGFPAPFDQIPISINWTVVTWSELVFAFMLLLGLFTRFAAMSLLIITSVAMAAVHWPAEWSSLEQLWQGYLITSDGGGNFKLPLLFVVMLLPLVFHGGGSFSLDYVFLNMTGRHSQLDDRVGGLQSMGLAFLVLGLVTFWVEPYWGYTLLGLAVVAILVPEFTGKAN
jgi:putative oxidoreductase